MILQQISVFVENRAGQLSEITGLLAENGIDMRALNIAESADYGVLRLIVSEPEKAIALLQQTGYPANVTPVVAAAVPDRPGGLHELLLLLAGHNVNLSYMYSIFGNQNGQAQMIFRVDDPEAAERVLSDGSIRTEITADLGI